MERRGGALERRRQFCLLSAGKTLLSANRFSLVVKIKRKIPVAAPHPPSSLPRCRRGALRLHIEQPLARITGEGADPPDLVRGEAVRVPRYQALGSHH